MDMKINFLPAKTWNWLRMNETEVKQVKADRQALEKEEIPETFAVEASTLEPIKTGMGPDMDKLAEQSGFAAKAYRMPAGRKEAAALRLGFVCKDQTASLDLIDLIAEENSEINASGVLKDASSKLFRGTIDFQHGSAESVGAEKEDVLLMGDDVVNQTIPLILCAEEDVKGSHGASIGQLDEETLFYMQARGISEEQAYALMADARIEAVCQKIPDETAQKLVKAYLGGDAADECEENS